MIVTASQNDYIVYINQQIGSSKNNGIESNKKFQP